MKEDAGSTFSAPVILMASDLFSTYILYDGQSRETKGLSLFAVNYVTAASSPEN